MFLLEAPTRPHTLGSGSGSGTGRRAVRDSKPNNSSKEDKTPKGWLGVHFAVFSMFYTDLGPIHLYNCKSPYN